MEAVGQARGAMTSTSKGIEASDAVNFEVVDYPPCRVGDRGMVYSRGIDRRSRVHALRNPNAYDRLKAWATGGHSSRDS